MHQDVACKLSICIPTLNRAQFIGDTLRSVVLQATNECEIVVLDGASTDSTEQIVGHYVQQFPRLRYIKQDKNGGFDRDLDRLVGLALGEYVWLMTDDDILRPDAVPTVLRAISHDYSLVILNAEVRDHGLLNVVREAVLKFPSDRTYGPRELDSLCADTCNYVTYLPSVVIKRAIWLERQRTPYYDSDFLHVGVIFQRNLPGDTLVVVKPCVSMRSGNALWWSRFIKLVMVSWPALVWSLPVSESTKRKVCKKEPWRELKLLLLLRAYGVYTTAEYRNWIRPRIHSSRETVLPALAASLPGEFVNAIFSIYYALVNGRDRDLIVPHLRNSPFHIRNWASKGKKT
jgi:abequosyltransferase